MKRYLSLILIIAIILSSFSTAYAQEVINSATGQGYGGSGSLDSDAVWLTGGTAIRVFPSLLVKDDKETAMANPSTRYRFLPFALYLFPDDAPTSATVHYNLHLSPDGKDIVRSTVPCFDLRSPEMAEAFRIAFENSLETANPRVSVDNLFVLRMLEIHANGKGFLDIDWSSESNADLVKEFFFTESNPLTDDWAIWFSDWAEANRALIDDYISAVSFAYIYLGLSGEYDIPSTEYQVGTALQKISYEALYQELVEMFDTTVDEERNWSIVFEPIADFYPSGNVSARAWTAATEIAQVLAEKVYLNNSELYNIASDIELNKSPSLKPNEGNYTRYQAGLFYALRNTSVFDNFIFREARAIFTNNFQSGEYQANKFLLADSLRPEVNNEDNLLGGWAIVYIKDLVPPAQPVKEIKYAVFVNHESTTIEAYSNLGSLTHEAWAPTLHYSKFTVLDRLTKTGNLTPTYRVSVISDFLSAPALNTIETLQYITTRQITLDSAYLPADFGLDALEYIPAAFDMAYLERIGTPVSSAVIGTAKYAPSSIAIDNMINRATSLTVTSIQSESIANATLLGKTETSLKAAISSLPATSPVSLNVTSTPKDYANLFVEVPASISALPVSISGTPALTSDGTPISEFSGTVPIVFGITVPQDRVTAVIYSALVTPSDTILEPARVEVFDAGQEHCIALPESDFSSFTVDNALILGWKTDKIGVDIEAISAEAQSQINVGLSSLAVGDSVSTLLDLDAIKTAFSADYAFVRLANATVCGAATDNGGILDGFTVAIVYLESPAQDLEVIEIIAADEYPEYYDGSFSVLVVNNGTILQDTTLTITVDSQPQSKIVTLNGGESANIQFNFPTGEAREQVDICAEINPSRNEPDNEVIWSNNKKCVTTDIIGTTITIDGACVTWTELRQQNEPIYRCTGIPPFLICRWIDNWVTYTLTFEACLDGEVEIDTDPNNTFPNVKAVVGGNPLKAGYGFALKAKTVVTPPDEQFVSSSGSGGGYNGSKLPTRNISAATSAVTELSWIIIPRPTLPTPQPQSITLNYVGNNGVTGEAYFDCPVSPISQVGNSYIYTDIDLAGSLNNPVDYEVKVILSGASWPDLILPDGTGDGSAGQLIKTLYSSIRIFGSMYEDDRTY